jgi:NAD(P)-dependent dehydrogenase (short-subunit alcohol dehydrogenase family)
VEWYLSLVVEAQLEAPSQKKSQQQKARLLLLISISQQPNVWSMKSLPAVVSHAHIKGSVVTLASVAAFIGSDEGAAYTTTKGAILSFTYAAAGDLAPSGVRVNAVSPGWVDGGFTHQAMSESDNPQELVNTAKNLHYLGRMAEPSDVANAVVWLLSDQAAFVTGTSLLVDGGYMIKH